jgi:hypothetical protein
MTLDGTNGVTFNDTSLQGAAASPYVLKNRIINGAMVVSQRNTTSSVTPASGDYTLDRWAVSLSQSSKFTVQQNAGAVTPPVGFSNYLGITSSSAYSITSGDFFYLKQAIEGFNTADLAWGTANAKTITLSFQVYSSLTGTFGGSLENSAYTRNYPFSYSIPTANTWTTISITIAGDTSGTWVGATNGVGLRVNFGLGVGATYSGTAGAWAAGDIVSATGATSVVGTSGATFYITGVQLEVGTSATPFERRMYGTELALCQRYLPMYTNSGNASVTAYISTGSAQSTTAVELFIPFPVTTRVNPTGLTISGAASNYRATDNSSSVTVSGVVFGSASTTGALYELTCTGATQFRPYIGYISNSATEFKLYFTGCEL